MSADPIDVVNRWLQNLLDPAVVNSVVAPDATYVSLNTDDPELQKIMPWTGTSRGPRAFLDNLGEMFTRWENLAFNVSDMFASGENVAVFGDFRYRSKSLDKVVSSPFSIHISSSKTATPPQPASGKAGPGQSRPSPAPSRSRCDITAPSMCTNTYAPPVTAERRDGAGFWAVAFAFLRASRS
jgi:hypothetical protein